MVTQQEVRAYREKNARMQRASGTATVWLTFYTLAALVGLVANAEKGMQVAMMAW